MRRIRRIVDIKLADIGSPQISSGSGWPTPAVRAVMNGSAQRLPSLARLDARIRHETT
jgi:hypothetical protein